MSTSQPEPATEGEAERPLQEIIADLTWDELAAGGIITLDEIDALLRAKGLDPTAYDYLYD